MTDLDPAALADTAERHWSLLGAVVAVIAWIVRVLILGPRAEIREARGEIAALKADVADQASALTEIKTLVHQILLDHHSGRG